MKCQHCGNELVPDEVFCGQCGNPNATPVQPTEMMQTPSFNNGFLGTNQSRPNQSAIRQKQGSQQQGGFYQDATEALSMAPNPSAQYPQQSFQNGPSMAGGYNNSGQFGNQAQQQPFLTGNYPQNMTYPPTAAGFASGQFGQGYGSRAEIPPKRHNAFMVAGIVCLIFAIITVGAVGTLFFLRGADNNQSAPTTIVQATATATAIPTPSPTPSPTPTATPSPTPTVVPTATPDANFSWCNTQCTQNGYQIEFPNGWSQGATQSSPGIQFQFTNPGNTDVIYAAVKTPSSGASSASDLLNTDITSFSSQPNFQGPQSVLSKTIGGENWSYSIITYQLNGQTEQVNIYATIHQGKSYVIELQATQAQFPDIDAHSFNPMLMSFQFVTVTP